MIQFILFVTVEKRREQLIEENQGISENYLSYFCRNCDVLTANNIINCKEINKLLSVVKDNNRQNKQIINIIFPKKHDSHQMK